MDEDKTKKAKKSTKEEVEFVRKCKDSEVLSSIAQETNKKKVKLAIAMNAYASPETKRNIFYQNVDDEDIVAYFAHYSNDDKIKNALIYSANGVYSISEKALERFIASNKGLDCNDLNDLAMSNRMCQAIELFNTSTSTKTITYILNHEKSTFFKVMAIKHPNVGLENLLKLASYENSTVKYALLNTLENSPLYDLKNKEVRKILKVLKDDFDEFISSYASMLLVINE